MPTFSNELKTQPDPAFIRRDLVANPPPHISPEFLFSLRITEVETIRIEGTALGEERKKAARERARGRVGEVVNIQARLA